MGDEFIAEQDRRRKVRLPDQIYDITAWSLPLLYDVELVISEKSSGVKTSAWTGAPRPAASIPAAKVGYLIPWGTGMAAAMDDASRAGLSIRIAGGPFTLAGRRYGIGTAILRNEENPADLRTRLATLVTSHALEIVPIDTSWVDDGLSLGSSTVRLVKPPRVLLAWDTPTQSLSAGWARFSLERRFNQPVTAVRVASMARANLADYDVIVLPAGNYGRRWASRCSHACASGCATAARWSRSAKPRDGRRASTCSTPSPSCAMAVRIARRRRRQPTPRVELRPEKYNYDDAITPRRERPEATSGVIARVHMNMEHWLSSGTDGEVQVMVEGDRVFKPLTLDRGTNVGVYADDAKLVASGLVWPEVRRQLARKAYLMHQPVGQGHLVAFAEDPNFRGFTELTQLLLMNAVLFGPAR